MLEHPSRNFWLRQSLGRGRESKQQCSHMLNYNNYDTLTSHNSSASRYAGRDEGGAVKIYRQSQSTKILLQSRGPKPFCKSLKFRYSL